MNSSPNSLSLVVDMDKQNPADIIHKPGRSLYLSPEDEPLMQAFHAAERTYQDNPFDYLDMLEKSVDTVRYAGHGVVTYSVIYDEASATSTEALVVFGGFSDYAPNTSAEKAYAYTQKRSASFTDKEIAQPNSWGPLVRSGTIHSTLSKAGVHMPVVTIFPANPGRDAAAIREGDYASYANLTSTVIHASENKIHGSEGSTHMSKIHFMGMSLGATEAIGAAGEIARREAELAVASLTVQELILGITTLPGLRSFTQITGEPSSHTTAGLMPIFETELRKRLDVAGNEMGMFVRMAKSIASRKITLLRGITRPDKTQATLYDLLKAGIPTTVALAANSQATFFTAAQLPFRHENIQKISIEAVPGKRIGHECDEHHVLVATTAFKGVTFQSGTSTR